MYITRQNVKIAPYEGVRISLFKAFNGSGADVFGNEIIEKTIPVTTVAYRTVGVGDPADYNAQFTQSGSQAIDIDGEVTEVATTNEFYYNTNIDIILEAIDNLK